jgi:superfamily II DNA/RNA helicase
MRVQPQKETHMTAAHADLRPTITSASTRRDAVTAADPANVDLSALGVSAPIVAALAKRGITQAFAIQIQALPPALAGRDVAGRAPTGSGKTLAFAIPVAQTVTRARPKHPRALILTPTRELAAQIADELRSIIGPKTSVATFYGGVGFGPQIQALRRGVDIAVACPGRLGDLIRRGECHLDEVEIAVLDEADRMADMGFLPEVRRLLDQVRADRQTLLFSATLDGAVDVLVRNYQRNPVHAEVAPAVDGPDRTVHTWLPVDRARRIDVAAELAERHGSTVMFCRTKRGADRVARQLTAAGVSAVAIHGGRTQSQRDRALQTFTRGHAQVLVATDVAARGIHVDDVACVVHFDVAGDHKDYVHRSGRTGRAGADGRVITLVTAEDTAKALEIQRALGVAGDDLSTRGGSSRSDGSRKAGPRNADSRGGSPRSGSRKRRRRGQGSGGAAGHTSRQRRHGSGRRGQTTTPRAGK